MRELGKRDVVKNVARSMLAAGLVQGITDAVSTPVAEVTTGSTGAEVTTSTAAEVASKATEETIKTFGDYAQTAIIQSAVNTVLSVAMDGQGFEEALKQGIAMAGINTVASWTAGKIGDLHKPLDGSQSAISATTHKLLHTVLGTGLGASMAAVTGQVWPWEQPQEASVLWLVH